MKPEAYEGNEKYIFISYAHKDSDIVLDIVNEITKAGHRIWYDDGIAAGSEWPETIAEHLDRAAAFIVFISPNSVSSDNCRNEINFALARKKPFLSVFIEDTEVPLGIELQIAGKQGVIRSKCRSRDEFISKITNSEIISQCRKTEAQTENTVLKTDGQEAAENRGIADFAAKSGAGTVGNIRANHKILAVVCAVAVILVVVVLVLNNTKKDRSALLQSFAKSVNTASKEVSEIADNAVNTAIQSSFGSSDESESIDSGNYTFDYPSFSGNEITVSNSKELEIALRDADYGDTIIIRSGEYKTDRTLFIDNKIRIRGEGDTKPIIHRSLRIRTGGVLIENIEINITDASQTYDSEYREDRNSCIETDGSDTPTYIRDIVVKYNAYCSGIVGYGEIVMENSYIDTEDEAIFLTAKADLNGNTLKSNYCGILVWGLYGKRDNPEERIEEFRNNNTFQAPTDIVTGE